MPSSSLVRRGGALLALVIAAAVLLLIWWPELRFYHVPRHTIAAASVEAARETPGDSILDELEAFRLYPLEELPPERVLGIAESILKGRFELPGMAAVELHRPLVPQDLDHLPAGLTQLQFAGWEVPDFLLKGYRATRREEFFVAARDFIIAWERMERDAWVPQGLLWNDHATAARVRVLATFWRAYRHHPDYDPATGRKVLELAARYRHFLSSASHFTFATNHGVMQNLGLLQLELAFPTLEEGPRYQRLAVERLGQQVPFFIDSDGIIRENSLGYQGFGLEMLGMAFRCMTLLQLPVPRDWADRYRQGLVFLDQARRPDGTLPLNGDTDGAPQAWLPRPVTIDESGRTSHLGAPRLSRPASDLSLHPVAGYWVEWEGLAAWPDSAALRQSMAVWTTPPAPGHKHADEMSVLLWARGVSWLNNVGYWPYEHRDREAAEQWPASNAPHLSAEPAGSPRSTRLAAAGRSEALAIADLERQGPGDLALRRQLVRIKPSSWIVLDQARSTATSGYTTVWTTDPGLTATRLGDSALGFDLTAPTASARLSFAGSAGTRATVYRGSHAPFAGWTVVGGESREAPAIVVTQPAGDAWLATVLSLDDAGTMRAGDAAAPQVEWRDAENWIVTLPGVRGLVTVRRSGAMLAVRTPTTADSVAIASVPDPAPELNQLRAAFNRTAAHYPVMRPLYGTRIKASKLVIALFVIQEILLLLINRRLPRYALAVRILSICCWVGLAGWLHFSLLRTWEVLRI